MIGLIEKLLSIMVRLQKGHAMACKPKKGKGGKR